MKLRYLFVLSILLGLVLPQCVHAAEPVLPWRNIAAPDSVKAVGTLTPAANKLPYFTGNTTTSAALTDFTSYGRSLVASADASAGRALLTLGSGATLDVPASGDATSGQLVKGNDTRLTDARPPTTHTHVATEISNSTATGRALLTATDAAAAKAALSIQASDLTAPSVYFMASFYWWDPNFLWAYGSADGKRWSKLSSEPIWRKAAGETATTDPRIFKYKGKWYICYSTGWLNASNSFGLITSDDFITWTKVTNVPVTGIPGQTTWRAWSPKPFIDDDGTLYIYISISFTDSQEGPFVSYAVTPTSDDLTTWNAPVAVTGIDTLGANAVSNYIDGSPVKVGSTYYYWFKDEDEATIQYATATAPLGPYTVQTTGDWAGFGTGREGISMVQITNTKWRIYFEQYPLGGFRWSESEDNFATWTTPVIFDPDRDPQSNPGVLKVDDAGTGQLLLGILLQNSKPANFTRFSLTDQDQAYAAAMIYANLWRDSVTGVFKQTNTLQPGWQLWMSYGQDLVAFDRYPAGSTTPTTMFLLDGSGNQTTTGFLKSKHATGGIGYTTGAGGAVTQTTSRATGVTINKVTGSITTDATSLAAGDSASFTVSNSAMVATDVPQVAIRSGATNKKTKVNVSAKASGSFEITVHNEDASTAETGAIIIDFVIIKGVTS